MGAVFSFQLHTAQSVSFQVWCRLFLFVVVFGFAGTRASGQFLVCFFVLGCVGMLLGCVTDLKKMLVHV